MQGPQTGVEELVQGEKAKGILRHDIQSRLRGFLRLLGGQPGTGLGQGDNAVSIGRQL